MVYYTLYTRYTGWWAPSLWEGPGYAVDVGELSLGAVPVPAYCHRFPLNIYAQTLAAVLDEHGRHRNHAVLEKSLPRGAPLATPHDIDSSACNAGCCHTVSYYYRIAVAKVCYYTTEYYYGATFYNSPQDLAFLSLPLPLPSQLCIIVYLALPFPFGSTPVTLVVAAERRPQQVLGQHYNLSSETFTATSLSHAISTTGTRTPCSPRSPTHSPTHPIDISLSPTAFLLYYELRSLPAESILAPCRTQRDARLYTTNLPPTQVLRSSYGALKPKWPLPTIPPQLPHLVTNSPALTPAVSRSSFQDEYTGPHVPPHSPFYQHPPSSNELSLPLSATKHAKVHQVHEKDLESGNDTPLTPHSYDEHPFSAKTAVEHTKECQMWPSTQTLKQKYKEDKKQRRAARGGCCMPVRAQWSKLGARNRILVKIAIAVLVIGIAVGLGVGISAAVKGSYFGTPRHADADMLNDGKSSQYASARSQLVVFQSQQLTLTRCRFRRFIESSYSLLSHRTYLVACPEDTHHTRSVWSYWLAASSTNIWRILNIGTGKIKEQIARRCLTGKHHPSSFLRSRGVTLVLNSIRIRRQACQHQCGWRPICRYDKPWRPVKLTKAAAAQKAQCLVCEDTKILVTSSKTNPAPLRTVLTLTIPKKNTDPSQTHAGTHRTDFIRLFHILGLGSFVAKNRLGQVVDGTQQAWEQDKRYMSFTRFTEQFRNNSVSSERERRKKKPMAIKGGLLRMIMITAYFTALICSLLIVGSFAWVYATTHNAATLGLAAVVLLYTAIQTLLICCTAGISLLWLFSIFGDAVSLILMIAIAGMNRSARFGCSGNHWRDWDDETLEFLREIWRDGGVLACRLLVAGFALALGWGREERVAIFMFVVTIICQVFVRRGRRGKVVKSEGDGELIKVDDAFGWSWIFCLLA
ncbi:uncharacterized protein MYCFIDRAFT_177329 [Pseudocercospora fijiensis CIRAD86]|uniref:Uncharacterized protein n=1 Tax=Pseudocercospora fijiensis (strain CIRAD86) TaxID=383855 RepID=M3A6Z3_PSEFD|nr:uncharacterized protein MYCFIDRAFT_177329 [Pseudocercospora fijiensis CIRAD86]EME80386.1 hypothetical protein MYCFIDRAFT_177329 [Pseudocercospora fijiensis CIRAD86]